MSPDEIELLIAEAAGATKRDQELKELIAVRNRLESLTRNAQRVYREIGTTLSADDRQDVQKVLADCVGVEQLEDAEELQRLLVETERVATLLTNAMLNSSGMGSLASPAPSSGKEATPGGVIERF